MEDCALIGRKNFAPRIDLTGPFVPGGLRETVLERSLGHAEEKVQHGADRDAASPD